MVLRIIIFLLVNFAALGIGGLSTNKGVTSEWYATLAKAPWTPPGWVFGVAWTSIMICFAIYMAYAWKSVENKSLLIGLFVIQWILNVAWNPVFFKYHEMLAGLVIISLLTVLLGYFFFGFLQQLKWISLLVLPYFLWLMVATTLNGYAYFNN
jgi:tryptophan-rich sensory protein